jgi:hypothetical protein
MVHVMVHVMVSDGIGVWDECMGVVMEHVMDTFVYCLHITTNWRQRQH